MSESIKPFGKRTDISRAVSLAIATAAFVGLGSGAHAQSAAPVDGNQPAISAKRCHGGECLAGRRSEALAAVAHAPRDVVR